MGRHTDSHLRTGHAHCVMLIRVRAGRLPSISPEKHNVMARWARQHYRGSQPRRRNSVRAHSECKRRGRKWVRGTAGEAMAPGDCAFLLAVLGFDTRHHLKFTIGTIQLGSRSIRPLNRPRTCVPPPLGGDVAPRAPPSHLAPPICTGEQHQEAPYSSPSRARRLEAAPCH